MASCLKFLLSENVSIVPPFLKSLLPVAECGPEALSFQYVKEVPASGSVVLGRVPKAFRLLFSCGKCLPFYLLFL